MLKMDLAACIPLLLMHWNLSLTLRNQHHLLHHLLLLVLTCVLKSDMILSFQAKKLLINTGVLWSIVMLQLNQGLHYSHFQDLQFMRCDINTNSFIYVHQFQLRLAKLHSCWILQEMFLLSLHCSFPVRGCCRLSLT